MSQPAPNTSINLDELTVGDLEDMESYVGKPVLALLQDSSADDGSLNLAATPAKLLTALVGVAKRKQDPAWTIDRWRDIPMSELGSGDEDEDEADPTPAADETPAA